MTFQQLQKAAAVLAVMIMLGLAMLLGALLVELGVVT